MLIRWLILVLTLGVTLLTPAALGAQPGGGGGGGPAAKATIRAVPQRDVVAPGDRLPIAVIMTFEPGWHAWPAAEVQLPADIAEFAIRTEIKAQAALDLQATLAPVQYPKAKPAKVASPSTGEPVEALAYGETAIAYIPVTIGAAPKDGVLKIEVHYQACNDSVCVNPRTDTVEVALRVAAPGVAAAPLSPEDAELFKGFSAEAFNRVETVRFDFFGSSFSIDPSGAGLVILVLLAALGGLLLNCTPCVLPVIPIKILGLSHAAGTRGRTFLLGLIMSAGVIGFWLAIGVAIASITGFKNISQLFQTPWFSVGIGVFMLVMGVGMLGAYVINLPNWIYAIDPSRESLVGSFGFGVMTAVLSTPCTAPFMGAAAGWAAKQPPALTVLTFTAIGVGMALPYLLLAANPGWVKRVPKTGPGSELLKQVMGLFILAVAAFFLGIGLSALFAKPPEPASLVYWWVVFGLVAGSCGWLIARTWKITKRLVPRVVFTLAGLAVALAMFGVAHRFTDRGPIKWVYYTPARFEEARAAGKVVVMDFTADWCLNCKAMEAAVLHRPDIVKLLEAPDVVPMKVDLTADNPDGAAKLRSLDWVGIPLLAFFGPGQDQPQKFDTYTPTVVQDALKAARSTPGR